MVTSLISPIFSFISEITEYSQVEITLYSIGYLITLFATLIYNEIIIFNCCNLNRDTKIFVNKIIDKELKEMQMLEMICLSDKVDNDCLIDDNNQTNEKIYIK